MKPECGEGVLGLSVWSVHEGEQEGGAVVSTRVSAWTALSLALVLPYSLAVLLRHHNYRCARILLTIVRWVNGSLEPFHNPQGPQLLLG